MASGHQKTGRVEHGHHGSPAFPDPRPVSRPWPTWLILSLATGCSDAATAPDPVPGHLAPVVSVEISRQDLLVGDPPAEVDLSAHFSHPNGDGLTLGRPPSG